jgi:hypothetical protein
MAMWARIMVNSDGIGAITIQRRSGEYAIGGNENAGPHTYDYDVVHGDRLFQGAVIHDYEDGALVLLAKVFADVTEIESARRVGSS